MRVCKTTKPQARGVASVVKCTASPPARSGPRKGTRTTELAVEKRRKARGLVPPSREGTVPDSEVADAGKLRVLVDRKEGRLDVVQSHCRLCLDDDGKMTLYRRENRNNGSHVFEKKVAEARLTLPQGATKKFAVVKNFVNRGQVDVRWGTCAQLRIILPSAIGNEHRDWAEGLRDGFLFEFTVPEDQSEMHEGCAEVTLNLEASGQWFGGGHLMKQHWPLNKGCWEVGPYYPFDNGPNGLNTLLSPHWMASSGLLAMADPDTPYLHVGLNAPSPRRRTWGVGVQNFKLQYLPITSGSLSSLFYGKGDGLLRIQARGSYKSSNVTHPLMDWKPSSWGVSFDDTEQQVMQRRIRVRFALCALENVKAATEVALKTLPKPSKGPPSAMVEKPIWTTWARYHASVDQKKVLQYATEIVGRGLERSVMEIDDKWQKKYGDLEFDEKKFPDVDQMVEKLHNDGFLVTLWVMPFVEEDSDAYREGAPRGYFVKAENKWMGLKPGFIKWWNKEPVVALDVTNPAATEWFVGRLKALQAKHNIDGFKFDAGEPCFLPPNFQTFAPVIHPTDYTRLYIERVCSHFEIAEVRTGHRTQSLPLMMRMGDRFSTWDIGNGLQSLIPTLLTSGLLGYPYCLPDMVGGNAYFGRKPDIELMVRWAQANALMPAVQFSIAPWDLSSKADRLCTEAMLIRRKAMDRIKDLAHNATNALEPICRPMWWLDPEDEETFHIFDQFAVGQDMIVAPVVEKGRRSRDVYLTEGRWKDMTEPDIVYEGKQWLRDLHAPLSKLPMFLRIPETPM